MISVEGYKAFHGSMKITPVNSSTVILIKDKDWLYKPEYNCWYGDGHSFSANICEPIETEEESTDEK